MTRKQFDALNIGDFVYKTSGPNKDIIMKIATKYFAPDGCPCITAYNMEETIYHGRKEGHHTSGAASCFKVKK